MKVTCGIKVLDGSSEISFTSGKKELKMPRMGLDGWFFYPEGSKKILPSQTLHLVQAPEKGLIRMLSGPDFDGIGEETAKKIVTFGCANVLRFLNDGAINLTQELLVSEDTGKSLREGWNIDPDERNLKILLYELGFSNSVVNFILDEYGAEIIQFLVLQPYSLANEIPRLSFEDIQVVVDKLKLDITIREKIVAGIQYCLLRVEKQRGHTAAPVKRVFKDLKEQFDFEEQDFEAALEIDENNIVVNKIDSETFLQTSKADEIEKEIVRRIQTIIDSVDEKEFADKISVKDSLPKGMVMSNEQLEVLDQTFNSPVSVITGGPGTGKTTIIIALLKALEDQGKEITVCAPTGRAAKRLSETPGMNKYKPTTIHMMLQTITNKSSLDVLVIDEASMIDASLMAQVCKVMDKRTRLVLIGDADQLPPVQAGQVFKDFINSGVIPVGRLTKIYRQQSGSDIISASQRIISGSFPRSGDGQSERDFSFIDVSNDNGLEKLVVNLYLHKLKDQLNFNPLTDIQIISPMRKGVLGIDNLNQTIQSILFGGHEPVIKQKYGLNYYTGDKIIQTKNNYEKGIMNGDNGMIAGKDEEGLLLVFDGKTVKYSLEDFDDIQLAYAISIHKSQGSEYPAVIIPISKRHQHMLGRNLIYTAITRGRNRVVVAGDRKSLENGIRAEWKDFRYSLLDNKLKQSLKN